MTQRWTIASQARALFAAVFVFSVVFIIIHPHVTSLRRTFKTSKTSQEDRDRRDVGNGASKVPVSQKSGERTRKQKTKADDVNASQSTENIQVQADGDRAPSVPMQADGGRAPMGIYRINPSVFDDPFYSDYPSRDSVGVRNANFLVKAIRQQFSIDGFDVFEGSKLIGILPAFYVGFAKCGSTAVYSWLKESLPCMLPVRKEGSHWINDALPECDVNREGLLTFCDPKGIRSSFTELASRKGNIFPLLQQMPPTCKNKPFIVSAAQNLWRPFMFMNSHGVGNRKEVTVDLPTVLKALTPHARMIGLFRETGTLLRSYYWYFSVSKSMDHYKRVLEHHLREIETDLEDKDSRCALLYSDAHFTDHPNIASFPTSCILVRWVKMFGDASVWITDGRSVTGCRDGILQWMGAEYTEGITCRVFQPTHSNVKESSREREYPADVAALEQRIAQLMQHYHPFLPTGKSSSASS